MLEKIKNFFKRVAGKIKTGALWVADKTGISWIAGKVKTGISWTVDKFSAGASWVADKTGISWIAGKIKTGALWVADKTGISWIAGKIKAGWNDVKSWLSSRKSDASTTDKEKASNPSPTTTTEASITYVGGKLVLKTNDEQKKLITESENLGYKGDAKEYLVYIQCNQGVFRITCVDDHGEFFINSVANEDGTDVSSGDNYLSKMKVKLGINDATQKVEIDNISKEQIPTIKVIQDNAQENAPRSQASTLKAEQIDPTVLYKGP